MTATDYAAHIILSVVLIIGVYQFYFWCQRNAVTEPRQLKLRIDDHIPFWPWWVWIYSFVYYPIILYLNFVIESPRQFIYVAMSYVLLLAAQMSFFLLFPVTTPEHWRELNRKRTRSERFLALVQRFDARSNSFPSMHMSVAVLTSLHLLPHFGDVALAFPVLIGLSCLFTKQHYVIDLPPGALLGGAVFGGYAALV